ncbi:MAG: LysR substrate-binding domain-containing protein, partial [Jannaschia sp.]
TWAIPALAATTEFRFDVAILDQDHSADALRRGEVTAAVTAESIALPGCDAWPLGALRYVACCTPAFFARHFGAGITAATLARSPVLQFTAQDALQSRWITRATGAKISPPAHRIAAPGPFEAAVRHGMGWGMIPEVSVETALDAGRLVELLPDSRLDTPLTWQVSRIMAATLAPLTRAMRRAGRAALVQTA